MATYRKRRRRKKRNYDYVRIAIAIGIAAVLIAAIVLLVSAIIRKSRGGKPAIESTPEVSTTQEGETLPTESTEPVETLPEEYRAILERARVSAQMYDYEKAIGDIQDNIEDYKKYLDLEDFVEECEAKKAQLIKWGDNSKITHIFFHTLVVDNKLAFGSDKCDQYNQVMTTVSEFNSILDQMYARGFVLVSIYDMAKMVQQEDGSKVMTYQPIYLPAGKTPFVLSVDDVCYYEYMKVTGGFANRVVIDENGKPVSEMDMPDGTKQRGAFDVMPILDAFIEEHPDFSYHGAKGIIALTGYNGILGYRTSEIAYGAGDPNFPSAYEYKNPNIEADREEAKRVAAALKEDGWIFASHTWGHMDMGDERSEDGTPTPRFFRDTDWWEAEVKPLIGDCDIIIFAFGADIGSWRGYDDSNQMYIYLKDKGFNYFCNVDSSTHSWVQLSTSTYGGGYLRQGRRNLDGMMLFKDALYPEKEVFSDLIEPGSVFDSDRPVPVIGIPVPEGFDPATWNAKAWADSHKAAETTN